MMMRGKRNDLFYDFEVVFLYFLFYSFLLFFMPFFHFVCVLPEHLARSFPALFLLCPPSSSPHSLLPSLFHAHIFFLLHFTSIIIIIIQFITVLFSSQQLFFLFRFLIRVRLRFRVQLLFFCSNSYLINSDFHIFSSLLFFTPKFQ